MSDTIVLKDCATDELAEKLAPLGGDLRLARRIQLAVVHAGAETLPEGLKEVRKSLWASISPKLRLPSLTIVERRVSPVDGFAKYLFRSTDGCLIEAVRIPLLHVAGDEKYVVCVSSQVGCAMGCAFCATGRLGFTRDLETWEIVDQVVAIRRDSPHPVRGVVFMGMGEPLMNYDAVARAARVISEPCGLAIDGKAITISTVGVVPGIRRLADEKRPWRLVVSLGTADPEARARLFPIDRRFGLEALREAVGYYHSVTGRRVTLAWPMIAGDNTTPAAVEHLARWVGDLPALINLIPINDTSGGRRPPGGDEFNAFMDALRAKTRIPIVRRYSGGQDIDGACGMLVARAMSSE